MIRTIALAYSGGLDTSIIVPWLKERYDARVICVAPDIGQGEELEGVRAKAIASGADECYIEDLRQEFVEDFVWPTLRAGAIYGRKYLLGTSMGRPLIARRQVEIARQVGADALAHGCTGKGNDQVRFELTYAAFAPDLPVIAPWREWNIRSREDAIAYAEAHKIPVAATRDKIYSRDRNVWHISHEGGVLEQPSVAPPADLFMLTSSPEDAPDPSLEARLRRVRSRVAAGIPEHSAVRDYYERPGLLSRVRVSFAIQEKPVGTADAVLAAEGFVGEDRFLVMNADNYYPVAAFTALRNLREPALIAFGRDALVVDGHIPAERITRFALLDIDNDGYLRRIVEKPDTETARAMSGHLFVSMNVWAFDRSIFEPCRTVQPSSRGELEIPIAVQHAIDNYGVRFRAVAMHALCALGTGSNVRP